MVNLSKGGTVHRQHNQFYKSLIDEAARIFRNGNLGQDAKMNEQRISRSVEI